MLVDAQSDFKITFHPVTPRLDPGEERMIDFTVEIKSAAALPEHLEVGVDILGDNNLLLKLWIFIEIRNGDSAL